MTSKTRPIPRIRLVRVIAAKELRESLRDGRFRLLAMSIVLLLAASLVAGGFETREARDAIAFAEAAERATWIEQGSRNPHSAAHFGNYAFKPRPVLSALDRGVDAYLGTAVWLEAHWQDPFALRPAEDRTAVQRFGELTAAFNLQVLVPLLIIVLGFGAFAGERERGTLLHIASLGLDAWTLALGKALGLGAALAWVLVPAGILTLAVVAGTGSDVAASAVLLAVYGVYFAIWLGLVLAVSAWASTGRVALVSLLGFWMLQSLILPRLVADIAETVVPVPTPRAFFAAIAEDETRGMDDQGDRAERRQRLEEKLLAEYGVATLEELPVNFAGLSLQASEEHSNLVYDKHYGDLWRRYLDQERLHVWGALTSPRLAVRALSMAIAGTDVARHRHFAQAAESHRRELVKFLNDDMTEHAGANGFGYLADEELWRATPAFSYQPPGLGDSLSRQGLAIFCLFGWLMAAVTLATLGVSRQRVVAEVRS